MTMSYPTLFFPLQLRHKTLKNRIVFGARTVNMSHEGIPAPRHFGYYRERARGGAAMIVVEPSPAHRTGVLIRGNFLAESDEVIPHFRKITDECHDHGTVMVHQIFHVGGHGDQDNSWQPYWSPSGLPSMHDPCGSHAMTDAEIEKLIEAFVQAARRDRDAGFDGVDLFAGYNCIIDQFWSPITNKRTDRWGGSLENRLRFGVRIVEGIRKMAGADFIIGMTISGAKKYPGGLSLEDKQEIVSWLDQRGLVDDCSVGTGSYLNQFSKIVPSFHFGMFLGRDDAAAIKEVVSHAKVTAEARIKTPSNAEEVLSAGKSDLDSIVRGQIADPHLANKASQGRAEDIRPCISCNQICIGRRLRDYYVSCLINPSVSREHEWDGDTVRPAERQKHVLLVGGGPAGMEAARVAAERGHRVRLVERTRELGGQFRLASGQPERGEIGAYLTWLQTQLTKLQVKVELGKDMTADDIRESGADEVILCTGSVPSRSGYQRPFPHQERLPGADLPNVHTIQDILDGSVDPGTNVLLLDDINGWWPASGTAIHLARQRHMVTALTASEKAAAQLDISLTGDTTRERFAKYGVEVILASALESWDGRTARIVNLYTGDVEERDFDSLVMALTNEREDRLTRELHEDTQLSVHAIGDTVQARTASMAIYEARSLAMGM
ncbi:FAD-dependent oxidoreductase [Defluviimonas sp. WL0002]|uniref:FAD-dependent oxidoreductase n=1 Tax=Albidovulum marisflavi TaxID=2984159 RepID=A0ABT2ZCP7_9RHOB|nr:FAD-dependent oxidoreductase [Defluviimonas sp. WL0002]MCV2868884.1 FAD-dependent oxidoreductase [Defluviimonas sp. WL0002]